MTGNQILLVLIVLIPHCFTQILVPETKKVHQLEFRQKFPEADDYKFKYFYPATFQIQLPLNLGKCDSPDICNITKLFPRISNLLNPIAYTSCEVGKEDHCHVSEAATFEEGSQVSFTRMIEKKMSPSSFQATASKVLKSGLFILSDIVPASILPSPFNQLLSGVLTSAFQGLKNDLEGTWLKPSSDDQERMIRGHKYTLTMFSFFLENLNFLTAIQVCESGYIPTSIVTRRNIDDKAREILDSFDFKIHMYGIPKLDDLLKLQIADCIVSPQGFLVVINLPVYEPIEYSSTTIKTGFSEFMSNYHMYFVIGFQGLNLIIMFYVIRKFRIPAVAAMIPTAVAFPVGIQGNKDVEWYEFLDEFQLMVLIALLGVIYSAIRLVATKYVATTNSQIDKLNQIVETVNVINNHVADIKYLASSRIQD